MRTVLGLMLGFVSCSLASQAQAQSYPSKPVRLIAAYAPGGATDVLGRLIATDLAKPLGFGFVVENRPGAGGRIGTRACKGAAPDGYTLCMMSPAQAIAPTLFKDAGYELNDFNYVTQIAKCAQSAPRPSIAARRKPVRT